MKELKSVDLHLISGNFFEMNVPKSKQYLLKYFKTDIQRQFVSYYLIFGNIDRFVEHTGLFCKKKWLKLLVDKFNALESKLKDSKDNLDFTTVALIESGKYAK